MIRLEIYKHTETDLHRYRLQFSKRNLEPKPDKMYLGYSSDFGLYDHGLFQVPK